MIFFGYVFNFQKTNSNLSMIFLIFCIYESLKIKKYIYFEMIFLICITLHIIHFFFLFYSINLICLSISIII
jgi:hypothetical protein